MPMPDTASPADEWTGRVGDSWAREWRRTDRSFGALTDRLLDPLSLGSYAQALDIGCGAGELVLRLATARPDAVVAGIDISPELVGTARARCAGVPNAHIHEGDAARHRPATAPDLLVSRHGVMFFADPVAAFAHLREQAAPDARLRFSCFRARAENAWARELAAVLPAPAAPPDPDAPGPFAFGDRDRIVHILAAAGWGDIVCEPIDYAMVAGEGADAIADAADYFQRIGPAARAMAALPEREHAAAAVRLTTMLERFHSGGRVALPAAAWIVTALVTPRPIA